MSIMKKIFLGTGVFLLLVLGINYGIHLLWLRAHSKYPPELIEDIYQNLAVAVIVSWVIYLVAYYIWAIIFYNINMGWTDEDWEKQAEAKNVNPRAATKEPDANPESAESLGLPSGTVRATIALSLLVAGLSMTIASLSMNNTYPANAFFIDHFEYFKTAFIMMIAFYFGSKSLEIIRDSNKNAQSTATGKPAAVSNTNDSSPAPDPIVTPAPGTLHDPEAKG